MFAVVNLLLLLSADASDEVPLHRCELAVHPGLRPYDPARGDIWRSQ
jgi:hypothetical protein